MKFRFPLFSFFLGKVATSIGISLGYIKGGLANPAGGQPLRAVFTASTSVILTSRTTSTLTSTSTSAIINHFGSHLSDLHHP